PPARTGATGMASGIVLGIIGALAAALPPARVDIFGDPLPAGAACRMGTLHFRHLGAIVSVAYAPDGKSVATGGDGTVCAWDAATGREHWRVAASSRGASRVAYSPDGKRIATAAGRSVAVRDAATGQEVQTFAGPEAAVVAVAFGPDGKTLFAIETGGAVR